MSDRVDILSAIKDLDFDPPKWDKRPCDEAKPTEDEQLDPSETLELDAEVAEIVRQKFQKLTADHNQLADSYEAQAATVFRLLHERNTAQAEATRLFVMVRVQRVAIVAMGLALLFAVGIWLSR